MSPVRFIWICNVKQRMFINKAFVTKRHYSKVPFPIILYNVIVNFSKNFERQMYHRKIRISVLDDFLGKAQALNDK